MAKLNSDLKQTPHKYKENNMLR